MGWPVVCGSCGTQVYTTGQRMPYHFDANGHPCQGVRRGTEADYEVGFDHHPRDYYGGAWEMGKDS